MEDFNLEDFKHEPSPYDYEAHHPEETFERSCIRTLNRIWIPNLPFSRLERTFQDSDCGDVLSYAWYKDRISFSNLSAPDLTFAKVKTAWKLNLHDLLTKSIRKTVIYKSWEEQPSEGFVFPLVGSQAIIFDAVSPPEFNCVITKQKDKFLVVSLLKDYATLFKEGEFYG